MALWYIEVHDSNTGTWESAGLEFDAVTARALQEELEAHGFTVRSRERGDVSAAEAKRLDDADDARIMKHYDRWQPYHLRAAARLRPRRV